MKTSDVMTKLVVSVPPTATLQDAVDLMVSHGISGLPVIDGQGILMGMVTEGDILRRGELGTEKHRPRWIELLMSPNKLTQEYIQTHSRRVTEIMTASVCTVSEDTPLEDVVKLMETRRIKRLPVMRGTRVVGIISRANLVRALAALRPTDQGQPGDADIRNRILKEIDIHIGTIGHVDVVVKDGVVDLWGGVFANRDAVRVAAENVEGVKEVHNHLIWYDPLSGWVIDSGADETPDDVSGTKQMHATLH